MCQSIRWERPLFACCDWLLLLMPQMETHDPSVNKRPLAAGWKIVSFIIFSSSPKLGVVKRKVRRRRRLEQPLRAASALWFVTFFNTICVRAICIFFCFVWQSVDEPKVVSQVTRPPQLHLFGLIELFILHEPIFHSCHRHKY